MATSAILQQIYSAILLFIKLFTETVQSQMKSVLLVKIGDCTQNTTSYVQKA